MANKYPTVFLHGFFGFGEDDLLNEVMPYFGFRPGRMVIPFLKSKGYEIFAPSVGPFNSAWDRCCILYAYLYGGTVDFGKVHSEKYGHARYGRTYPGVLKDWGEPGDHAKINIVGHSFGGPTVITFSDLMTNGFQEEIDGTPADELSPLFKGGQGDKLHTVTTLSGVNNGTILAEVLGDKGVNLLSSLILGLITAIGESKTVMSVWDMNMAQWGIMPLKTELKGNHFQSPFAKADKIKIFNKNKRDSVGNEMQIETRKDLVDNYATVNPNTYYFARIADRSHPLDKKRGIYLMDFSAFILPWLAGLLTGTGLCNKKLKKVYGYDPEKWGPNDGLVNVEGQKAPFGLPCEDADYNDDFKPGLWYNLPTEYKDHMSWTGILEKSSVYFQYMEDMVKKFSELDG